MLNLVEAETHLGRWKTVCTTWGPLCTSCALMRFRVRAQNLSFIRDARRAFWFWRFARRVRAAGGPANNFGAADPCFMRAVGTRASRVACARYVISVVFPGHPAVVALCVSYLLVVTDGGCPRAVRIAPRASFGGFQRMAGGGVA